MARKACDLPIRLAHPSRLVGQCLGNISSATHNPPGRPPRTARDRIDLRRFSRDLTTFWSTSEIQITVAVSSHVPKVDRFIGPPDVVLDTRNVHDRNCGEAEVCAPASIIPQLEGDHPRHREHFTARQGHLRGHRRSAETGPAYERAKRAPVVQMAVSIRRPSVPHSTCAML